MERYDQHVHTRFSFDGKMDVDEACEEAVRQGLDGLTFTEHFSMDELDPSYHFLRYDAYRAAVEHARETYDGRLAIGFGLEISEPHIEKCRAALAEARQTMTLDFVIGSVHNIGSVKLRRFMESKTKDEAYAAYFREVLQMVQSTDIDVIGHLDLAKRYFFPRFGDYAFAEYRGIITEILQTAIARGIGIEINTSGYRNAVGVPYPSPDVLTLYRDLGGRRITIGSDAHSADVLAKDFDRACDMLRAAGFWTYNRYIAREPHPVAL